MWPWNNGRVCRVVDCCRISTHIRCSSLTGACLVWPRKNGRVCQVVDCCLHLCFALLTMHSYPFIWLLLFVLETFCCVMIVAMDAIATADVIVDCIYCRHILPNCAVAFSLGGAGAPTPSPPSLIVVKPLQLCLVAICCMLWRRGRIWH